MNSFTNKIIKLAEVENNLIIKNEEISKEREIRKFQEIQAKIKKEYNNIYEEYLEIFKSESDFEALKRLIFLQWYAQAEPPNLISLPNFSNVYQNEIMQSLESLFKLKKIDNEFKLMLRWYYSNTDWYFRLYRIPFLQKYLEENKDIPFEINTGNFKFDKRGLMGIYWNSLNRKIKDN
ncbi:hypothetical protein LPTSP4_36760 [Leptospira ryugenii]|uniref:Uncharacterized protein n=1 Tax=Leptospira ryugenii TaxID=1917863 RepID=A0A2P2E5J1_9LEPT|nr:hypothetical protein [Leptospira ryugenii]GBF52138.1 hypothetical protein LPTSP4_36760 [Leptospira ryugenii]